MYDNDILFLDESVDLLELAEQSEDYYSGSILEALDIYMAGFYNPKKLSDDKYVKDLTKRINSTKTSTEKIVKVYVTLQKIDAVICAITIIGIPIALLKLAIIKWLNNNTPKMISGSTIKSYENIIKNTDKFIIKLKKSIDKEKDESKKKQLKDTLVKIEDNKKKLIAKKEKAEKELKDLED